MIVSRLERLSSRNLKTYFYLNILWRFINHGYVWQQAAAIPAACCHQLLPYFQNGFLWWVKSGFYVFFFKLFANTSQNPKKTKTKPIKRAHYDSSKVPIVAGATRPKITLHYKDKPFKAYKWTVEVCACSRQVVYVQQKLESYCYLRKLIPR